MKRTTLETTATAAVVAMTTRLLHEGVDSRRERRRMRLERVVPLAQRREVDTRGAERAAQICVALAQCGDAPATDRAAERTVHAAPDDPPERSIELVPQHVVPGVEGSPAPRVVVVGDGGDDACKYRELVKHEARLVTCCAEVYHDYYGSATGSVYSMTMTTTTTTTMMTTTTTITTH